MYRLYESAFIYKRDDPVRIPLTAVVLALIQLFDSAGSLVGGWLGDNLTGGPQFRIGAILIVQAIAGVTLFFAVAATDSEWSAIVTFSALGFFVIGNTGVYYSYMATLVTTDEMSGATAGGQLALVVGSIVAPPAFGYLADTVGYRGSWWLLAPGTVVASGLLVYSVRLDPPVAARAVGE